MFLASLRGEGPSTWRIIPITNWLITMVSFRPLTGVKKPLPNGILMAYEWDDPPSRVFP